jgi:isoleucyl-tRNA synthetase
VVNKLEIFSPVSEDGRYTEGIQPESLAGMKVTTEGQQWALRALHDKERLLHLGTYQFHATSCAIDRCVLLLLAQAMCGWS